MSSARDTRRINPRGQVFVQSEVAFSPVRTLLTWQRTEISSPSGCGVWVHPASGSQTSTVQASPSSHEDPQICTVVEVVLVVATVVVGAVELELVDDVVDGVLVLVLVVGTRVVDVVVVTPGSVEEVDVALDEVVEDVVDELVLLDVDGGAVELVVVVKMVVVEAGAVEELGTEVDEIEVEDVVDGVLVLVVGTRVVDVVVVVPAKVAV